MMKGLKRTGAAFEPPSDYVGDAGGSGRGKKIWMFLGGGCLVVLLIIGGLFAAGAFKAISCCNQFQDVAKRSMAAQTFGVQFATAIASGELDQAHANFTPELKTEVDRKAFGDMVAKHDAFIKAAAAPRMINMQAQHDGGELADVKSWRQTYQFSGGSSEKMLVLEILVVQLPEGAGFQIGELDFDVKARNMELEPPAKEVLEFHDELQRGNEEMAFGRLGKGFRDETDLETFKAFLTDQGDLFTDSEMTIRAVDYNGRNSATVMASVEAESGKKAIVQYELGSAVANLPTWEILTISPILQKVEDGDGGTDANAEGAMDAPDAGNIEGEENAPEPASNESTGEDAKGTQP